MKILATSNHGDTFNPKEGVDVRVIIAGGDNLSKYFKYVMDVTKFEICNEFISNGVGFQLFQHAQIVVLPYMFHKWHSGVINVARSFGKPVIVTSVEDHPNMIENEKDGLIVPHRDSEALAEAVIKLLKDNDLRKDMGANAYKKAQELSWGNIAKKHVKVYEEVMIGET